MDESNRKTCLVTYNNMKVSFILPIYNVEKYLSECVESILAQAYSDFEILLVDDGSPDNCPALCDEWAKKDSRIKALHKPNGGLSDARNYGLDHAQGDYVVFVDSDDFWMGRDSLEKLIKVVDAHPECDFIGYNCSYYYSDTKTYAKWVRYDENLVVPTDKNVTICSLVASGTMPMSACLKIIKRKSLSDMGLKFIKGTIAEDIPWFIDLLDGSKKCMFVNQYIYAYRQNVAGSITASGNPKSTSDLFTIVKNEIKKMDSRNISKEAKEALYSFLAYEFCILLTSDMPKEMKRELIQYKWLLNYTANPKVRKAAFVNKLFGIKVTEWVLKFYTDHIRK